MTDIQQEAERRYPPYKIIGNADLNTDKRNLFIENATFGYSLAQQEIERLKFLCKMAFRTGGHRRTQESGGIVEADGTNEVVIPCSWEEFKQQHNL